MSLHLAMVAVLTGLDEFEQDTVERLCWDDWDRVTFDESGRVHIDGRPTIFVLEPEEDPEAQYFLDTQPQVIVLDKHIPYGGPGPIHTPDCPDVLATDHDVCPPAECKHEAWEERGTWRACVDCPHGWSVAEAPVVIVDNLSGVQQAVMQDVLDEHQPLCPCGCGQPVINAQGGRKRKWATEACRRRGNEQLRAQERAEARLESLEREHPEVVQAAQVQPSPATPVLDLAPDPGPRCQYCGADCSEARSWDGGDLYACPPCADGRAEAHRRGLSWPLQQLSTTLEPLPAPQVRKPFCARCDQEGHCVEDCPRPSARRRQDRPTAGYGDTAPGAKTFKTLGRTDGPQAVLTCGRCGEKGHSMLACPKPVEALRTRPVLVRPITQEGLSDDDLTAHSASLLDLCRQGLPSRFQYTFLEDVLALYGVDHDLLDAALRNPEKVEIRAETFAKDKRYCVLAFDRGDLQVILGMREPSTPKVIAVYAHSRLEHDTHRVDHMGKSGGARDTAKGLPKSGKQVAHRLRAMGAEVEINIVDDYVPVTYKGQDMGKIACDGDRATSEQDYQRVQRRMAAVDRRASA